MKVTREQMGKEAFTAAMKAIEDGDSSLIVVVADDEGSLQIMVMVPEGDCRDCFVERVQYCLHESFGHREATDKPKIH